MTRLLMPSLLLLAFSVPVATEERGSAAANQGASAQAATPAGLACAPAADTRVFELRTYHCNEGKLADLHTRFRDHTCTLLKKHGAELIGFWTPLDEKSGKGNKLIYLVAFPSREAAKKTWDEFGKDPVWRKVYEESHKNGKLVKEVESVYMEPTDYSEMK